MTKISDQRYLRADQYRDASKLDARVELHKRFSTNPYGWPRWVFDRLNIAPHSRILELGCGPAYLWSENLERIPAGLSVMLSDPSYLSAIRETHPRLLTFKSLVPPLSEERINVQARYKD